MTFWNSSKARLQHARSQGQRRIIVARDGSHLQLITRVQPFCMMHQHAVHGLADLLAARDLCPRGPRRRHAYYASISSMRALPATKDTLVDVPRAVGGTTTRARPRAMGFHSHRLLGLALFAGLVVGARSARTKKSSRQSKKKSSRPILAMHVMKAGGTALCKSACQQFNGKNIGT